MEFLNESNRSEAINLLAHDIKNCSHFCTANEKRNETFSRDNFNANDIQTSLKVKAISNFGQKAYLYQEELVAFQYTLYTDMDKQMLSNITVLLNRLATKSEILVGKNTTNIADSARVIDACQQ